MTTQQIVLRQLPFFIQVACQGVLLFTSSKMKHPAKQNHGKFNRLWLG